MLYDSSRIIAEFRTVLYQSVTCRRFRLQPPCPKILIEMVRVWSGERKRDKNAR